MQCDCSTSIMGAPAQDARFQAFDDFAITSIDVAQGGADTGEMAVRVAMASHRDHAPRMAMLPVFQWTLQDMRPKCREVRFEIADTGVADPIFLRQCVYTAAEQGVRRVVLVDRAGNGASGVLERWAREMKAFMRNGIEIAVAHGAEPAEIAAADGSLASEPVFRPISKVFDAVYG